MSTPRNWGWNLLLSAWMFSWHVYILCGENNMCSLREFGVCAWISNELRCMKGVAWDKVRYPIIMLVNWPHKGLVKCTGYINTGHAIYIKLTTRHVTWLSCPIPLSRLPFLTSHSHVAVFSFAGGLTGEDLTRQVGAYPSWEMKKLVLS